MKAALLVCVLGLLAVFEAYADSSATQPVKTYFKALSDTSKQSCESLKQLKKKYQKENRPSGSVESVKATMYNICNCLPAQIKQAKSKLKRKELKAQMTRKQFLRQFQPIIDNCAAAQLRYPYGKNCEQRFSEVKSNSANYCKCMGNYIKTLSNAEATQIGRESSQHEKATRISREHGLQAPAKPQLYAIFLATDDACSAPNR